MAKRELVLTLIGNAKSAVDAIRLTESSSEKLQRTVAGVSKKLALGFAAVGAAGIYMGKQVFDGGLKMVHLASNLEESQSKVNAVFGDSANVIQDFAKTTATSLGITRQATLEAAGTFGNLIQAFGISKSSAATMSQTMVTLAADLASFNNVPIEDVFNALRSGLSGETEPLKRFGVALNDVRLKEEAMRLGLYKGKGALDITAKTQAAYALILKDTSLAQGDVARTSDGFANQMRFLKAALEDAGAELGLVLLPYAKRFVTFINDNIIPGIQAFAANLGEQGLTKAFYLGIAAMGDFGLKGINSLEAISLAALTAIRKIVDLGEKVLFVSTLFNLATRNATGFIKTWSAGFGLDRLKGEIDDAIEGLPASFDALRDNVSRAQRDIDRFTNDGLNRPEPGKDFRGDMGKTTNAVGDFDEQINKTKKSTEKAQNAIASFNKELKQYNSATRSATQAAEDLKEANDDVAKATTNLERVQSRVTQLLKGFGAGSKEAAAKQDVLDRATRDVERAGYGVEESVFAVAAAERDLNEIRKRSGVTPEEIRLAEIRLAEAKLSVRDSIDAQKQAVLDQTEAERQLEMAINGVKEGTNEYLDLMRELQDAQEDQIQSIKRAEDARYAEAKAIEAVKDAEIALAEARGKLPKGTTFDETTGEAKEGKTVTYPNFMTAVKALHPNAKVLQSKTPVRDARAAFPDLYKEYKEAGRAMAEGGIVKSPFQALIGEAGPEAVIPLDRLGDMGTTNVYVTINAGMGTDPASVADEIVNVLQKYNRRNGALPLKVA